MLATWLDTFSGKSHFACSVSGSRLQTQLSSSQNSPVLIAPPLLPAWLSHLYFLPGNWPISILLKYSWQGTNHCPTVYVCTPQVCLVPREVRGRNWIPWNWGCEPSWAENWTYVLWMSKERVFLITKPSFQPPFSIVFLSGKAPYEVYK